MRSAAKADQPPIECTALEPEKSTKPWLFNQPSGVPVIAPCHVHRPKIG